MQYLFGPVPSRRLGISLGIDLVPFKTCSMDCIYCECGKTTTLTGKRAPLTDTDAVLTELDGWLADNPAPDWITFGGSGEPTLCSGFGGLAAEIRRRHPDIKLAILTNSTLTGETAVLEGLLNFDLILPSLDAASERSFQLITRPVPGISLESVVTGLTLLRRRFSGTIWLEVFIVPGINDSAEELEAFRTLFEKIQPDQIQLNTLDRPGTESGLIPASLLQLEQIRQLWGEERTVIIARGETAQGAHISDNEAEKRIILTAARRPLTRSDITVLTGRDDTGITAILERLTAAGTLQTESGRSGLFYRTAQQHQ